MEKTSEEVEDSPEEIKRRLKVVERELDNLLKSQWTYAKRMLKFGSAAWIFGLSAFITALLIYQGPTLILNAPPISISLLIGALAAPIAITSALLLRQRRKVKRLERVRLGLLSQHEKALLRRVEEDILS